MVRMEAPHEVDQAVSVMPFHVALTTPLILSFEMLPVYSTLMTSIRYQFNFL